MLNLSRVSSLLIAGVFTLSLAACADSNSEPTVGAVSESEESLSNPVGEDGTLVVPLPSVEAKRAFIDVVENSVDRFYRIGAVETFRTNDGFESSAVYLPNFEPSPVAFNVSVNEDQEVVADWVPGMNTFSARLAEELVFASQFEAIGREIKYSVLQMPDGRFIVSDEIIGASTYFVENNLIVGRELLSDAGEVIGVSRIEYRVGQLEIDIAQQLVEQSDQEELDLLFGDPEETENIEEDREETAEAPEL